MEGMKKYNMENIKIRDMYSLEETIAKDLLEKFEYPWEVLPHIKEYIIKLGNSLPEDIYDKKGDDIWIAKSAKVFDSAYIGGPCIIDEEAEVRHCAFIRGSAIVGKRAVVGNSTELKNVILFNKPFLVRNPARTSRRKRVWRLLQVVTPS